MSTQPFRSTPRSCDVIAVLVGLLLAIGGAGLADASDVDSTVSPRSTETLDTNDASADESSDRSPDRGRGLEPTFQPREPVPEPWYNSDYIFGMTRGVANSTMAPAGKAPLFVLTVPLDIVILPFALIGGFFG